MTPGRDPSGMDDATLRGRIAVLALALSCATLLLAGPAAAVAPVAGSGAPGAGVGDPAGAPTDDATTGDATTGGAPASDDATPRAWFPAGNVTEHAGDAVRLTIRLENATTATVDLDPPYRNEQAEVVVTDGDGDGRVTLLVATYLGGPNDSVATYRVADPEDAVRIRYAVRESGHRATGEYRLGVSPGAPGTDGGEGDAATLQLTDPTAPNVTVGVAPAAAFEGLDAPGAIRSARRNGTLAPAERVALGDTLVVRIDAPGLEGALRVARSNASVTNTTEAFRALVAGPDADLRAEQTNPPPERLRLSLDLLDPRYARVVADAGNDTYWLVVDTARLDGDRDGVPDSPDVGHEYGVNVTVAGSLAPDGPRSATDEFAFVPPTTAVLDRIDGRRYVTPDANATVTGRTTLAPGTRLRVLVTADGRTLNRTVVVRPAETATGRFRARFDLSTLSEGDRPTADVRHDGRSLLDDPPVELVVDVPRATIAIPEGGRLDPDATRVTLDRVNLSRGGFVVLRRGSVDGPTLAVSYPLSPGQHRDLQVWFGEDLADPMRIVAVAYRDVNGNRDFEPLVDRPYRENGSVVADAGTFRPMETTPDTPTTSGTPTGPGTSTGGTTPGTTPTTAATPSPTPTTGDATTDDPDPDAEGGAGVPGFGVLPAVAALVLAALLSRRVRRR